jgi:hypothetical protein
MADVTEVIKRLIVEAQTRGLDKAAADFEKFGTAAKQAATSTENSLASTSKSFERLAGSIDPARKEIQALARDLKTLESARGKGVSDEYINGLKEARTASGALAIEAAKTNAAIGAQANGMAKLGPAVGLARHEMINFGRQAQDVFVQLASGQSAIMTLVQQGPQIADVFTTSQGSLKGFAAQMGSAALSFGPVIAGLAAVATAVYAVNRAMEQNLEARQALGGGRGRFLGITPGDVTGAAGRVAGGGVSSGEAREGIIGGIRAGVPSLDVLERGQRLAQQYAATVGSDLKKAQEEINQILGDRTPRSFEAAAKSLGTYDAKTVDLVRSLQSQGQYAQAAQVQLSNLSQGLVTNADAAGKAAQGWALLKTKVDQALDALGNFIVKQESLAERAEKLRRELARAPILPEGFGRTGEVRGRKRGELNDLEQQLQDQADMRERGPAMLEESRQNAITKAIEDATRAQRDQIGVMNALTIEQKAAATATQTYNQLTEQGIAPEEARAKAVLASAMVIAQAANEMTRSLQAQQNQLSALRQQQSAVSGGAGETDLAVLNAKLQERNTLLAQGVDLASKEAQQRIANAGAIARETAALQDQIAARNILKQAAVEGAGLRADLATAGEEQSVRTAAIETAKLQVQVEQLLADGKTQEAAATAKARTEIIQLTYARDADAEAARDEADAIARKNARLYEEAQAQQAVADARSRATAAAEAGFAKASTFSTPWAKQGQQATITGPKDTEAVVWGGGGFKTDIKFVPRKKTAEEIEQATQAREQAEQRLIQIQRQAMQTAISTTASAIGKQISALREATQMAGDTRQKQQDLESKLQQQEDKRQSRIQNYLAAGPSPFEQNADIFYDPKKRMAFAETIAGNTDELLKQQIAQAKAEADAAEGASKAAEAQIKALEDQQERLQEQSELISAGVDLSKQEVDGINALIAEVANNLPTNIADNFARMFSAQQGQAQKDAADAAKAIPGGGGGGGGFAGFGGSTLTELGFGYQGGTSYQGGGSGGLSGGGSLFGKTTIKKGAALGGFAGGGEFTVPGSYGAGDRPFVMGLAGQEKVTIQTPGQQRSGGSRGASIENLIVQMPPMTDPIIYLNKRSRPALGRAIRGAARGMA